MATDVTKTHLNVYSALTLVVAVLAAYIYIDNRISYEVALLESRIVERMAISRVADREASELSRETLREIKADLNTMREEIKEIRDIVMKLDGGTRRR